MDLSLSQPVLEEPVSSDVGLSSQRMRGDRAVKRDNRGAIGVALDVHETKSGSYERPRSEQKSDIAYLEQCLQCWEPSQCPRRAAVDEAVRAFIVAVLQEEEGYP